MPLISVIVPVYKVENYIKDCIESILSQTFTDFELILVDDGSPDNCPVICDEYKKSDSRIKVIHQKNGGLSAARNTGIDYAMSNESNWVTFIDSDDWVEPDYLECLYEAVKESGCNVSICSCSEDAERNLNSINTDKKSFSVFNIEDLWVSNRAGCVIACAKLFNKSLFEDIRFPVGIYHEDEAATYKLLFKSLNVSFTDSQLYHYYQNPQSIMHSGWNKRHLDAVNALLNQIEFFKDNDFKKAEKGSADSLVVLLFNYKKTASDANDFYLALKFYFKLRFFILRYQYIMHYSVSENEWFYAKVYPAEIKVRSIIIKIFNTIFRRNK